MNNLFEEHGRLRRACYRRMNEWPIDLDTRKKREKFLAHMFGFDDWIEFEAGMKIEHLDLMRGLSSAHGYTYYRAGLIKGVFRE